MPHSKKFYHNCKRSESKIKVEPENYNMESGSTDSGFTMLENDASSALMENTSVTENFARMEVSQRMESSGRMCSTSPLHFLRYRNRRFSGHVRSRSAPEGLARFSGHFRTSSKHPDYQQVETEENVDDDTFAQINTRYVRQKSTTPLMNDDLSRRDAAETECTSKDEPEKNIEREDTEELLELFNSHSPSQITPFMQRLRVNTSSRRQQRPDLVPDHNSDYSGTEQTGSLLHLEELAECPGAVTIEGRGGCSAGVGIPFGGCRFASNHLPQEGERGGYGSGNNISSNLSSPTGVEESRIDRVVKNLLRISGEIETDEGFRHDFGALAMEVTNSLEDESFLNDFPSFSNTMDNILDQYYHQASFSSATPFKKMWFIFLVNILFIRRLRQRTSQFLSTMVDYATQYIASVLPVRAMIRRSSSAMSDLCNVGRPRAGRGEGAASPASSGASGASRSRLSSVGAISTTGIEENLFSTSNRSANRSSIYSSTFDLDLSSISAGSIGAPCGNNETNTSQGPSSLSSFGVTGGGFAAQGIQIATSTGNLQSLRVDNNPLHAMLSQPLLPSNHGATPFASPTQQQQVPMATPTSLSMGTAMDGNGNTPCCTSRYGDIAEGRRFTSLVAVRPDIDTCEMEEEDATTSRSFQSASVLRKFFNTAKDKESSSEPRDPQGSGASKPRAAQAVVRKKDPKVAGSKKRLTESASYDFAPVRRKESDVDSAFCTEEECFTFPSFGSSVDHEPGLLMRHPGDDPVEKAREVNRDDNNHNGQGVSSSSQTRPIFLAQTREEYRQAVIRRRRLFGMQGRLPSFSDEMTAAFTGVHTGSLGAAEDYFAPRSVPNERGFSSRAHIRGDRNATGSESPQTDQGMTSVYVTVTLLILAAIIRYPRS